MRGILPKSLQTRVRNVLGFQTSGLLTSRGVLPPPIPRAIPHQRFFSRATVALFLVLSTCPIFPNCVALTSAPFSLTFYLM